MIDRRSFVSCLLLVLLGQHGSCNIEIQGKNATNPVVVRELHSGKITNGTLKSNTVHVYYLHLDHTYILDLVRVAAEIDYPPQFKKETGTILELTASNGRDNLILKLPVVYPNLTLYKYGKLLNPLIQDDFGPKRTKKNTLENGTLTQIIAITVQSRLREDIDYRIHFTRLDRSQFDLKFKSHESKKILANQKLTFVKPIGFFLDAEEQRVNSFHITATSDDDFCASLITVPANESIYDRPVDADKPDNRRVITFTKRADVFFSETEIEMFKSFRIFVFINPEDSACSANTSRVNFDQAKKITFEFTKLEPSSYFVPTLVMLAFFAAPILIVAIGITVIVIRSHETTVSTANLISISSDHPGEQEHADVDVENSHNEVVTIPEEENLQDQQLDLVPVNYDSLSLHGEMLKYPFALILPVMMHTGIEYHKFTTSTMANRDEMCFHNNACAKPWGDLRAWNNIISNIGYAIYGFVFILITMMRRWRHVSISFGTYECTLLDITIGLFMILQAFASATYHICPSDIAFQFDTPCIQVICGLLIIRQWLVRQESPSPSYTNMLLFGVVFLNFTISAFSKSSRVRLLIATIHSCVVATLCLAKRKTLKSRKTSNAFTICFAVVNTISIIFYVASSSIHLNQITTYCFILNCIMYLVYYAAMKFVLQESMGLNAKVLGALAIIGWIAAGFFFFKDDTDWTRTAAASRALNEPCLLLDFFGSHDLWHIFGALAGLFTFLFVSFVDDDLVSTPKSSLNVC